MSLRGVANLLRRFGLSAIIVLAAPALSWAQGCANGACFGTPSAGGGGGACGSFCGSLCQTHHCPPAYVHCLERAPCIRWKHGCPRPVCNPCDLPHWGYFDTCWTPWPWPADWTHCPTPPPAQFVTLNPTVHPGLPAQPQRPGVAPAPRSGGMPAPTFSEPRPSNGNYNGNGPETLPPPQRFEGQRSPF
jgi:hypothetical protein